MREGAVAVPEEAHHRHHAVDGVVELRRRRDVARRERLAQRQEIEQQFDQRAGIAADVAAVGQDLALDLGDQLLDRAAHVPRLARPCRAPHRSARSAPAAAARRRAPRSRCGADSGPGASGCAGSGDRTASSASCRISGAWLSQEMMRRAMISGLPADRMPGALQRDPFVDQRARIGAGDAGLGGAQMAQPAEAEQRRRPFVRRRRDLERRAAVADHDLAGEGETAGVDFAGAGAVGGAQILRRDQQPVGLARDEAPADQRMAAQPPGDAAQRPPRPGAGTAWPAPPIDRPAMIALASSDGRGRRSPRLPRVTYSEGAQRRPTGGQAPSDSRRFAPRRSRRARPCGARDRASGRAGCAGRRPAVSSSARPPTSSGRIGPRRSAGLRPSSAAICVLALLGLQRAGAIDQRAAGLEQRRGVVEQPGLQRRRAWRGRLRT